MVTPAIFFHFFCVHVTNQHEKLKEIQKEIEQLLKGDSEVKVVSSFEQKKLKFLNNFLNYLYRVIKNIKN